MKTSATASFRISARAVAAAALLLGAAAKAASLSLVIAPGKFDEHCLKMSAGAEIVYRFEADGALDFNIHHHQGQDVLYPVKRDGVRSLDDRFRAPAAGDYCLMWENKGQQPVKLRVTVEP